MAFSPLKTSHVPLFPSSRTQAQRSSSVCQCPLHRPPVYIPSPGSENWNSTTSTYQPEALYLPFPVLFPAVDSPFPHSSYDGSAPPKFIGEKRPRLAEFGEENILPEDEVRN
jgi:hypothetical protein